MKVVAVITDLSEVNKILECLSFFFKNYDKSQFLTKYHGPGSIFIKKAVVSIAKSSWKL